MDITQLLVTVAACVGILIVGLLAIVPTALELPTHHRNTASLPAPTPMKPRRPHRHTSHDLAA